MAAARMGGIQAVVAELGDVHDGTVTARQLHFHEDVADREGTLAGRTVGRPERFGPDEARRTIKTGCSPIKAIRELGSEVARQFGPYRGGGEEI